MTDHLATLTAMLLLATGCGDNSAGLSADECVTVRELGSKGRCFVMCDGPGERTDVLAIECPLLPFFAAPVQP